MKIHPKMWDGVPVIDRTGDQERVVGHMAKPRILPDGSVVADLVLDTGETAGQLAVWQEPTPELAISVATSAVDGTSLDAMEDVANRALGLVIGPSPLRDICGYVQALVPLVRQQAEEISKLQQDLASQRDARRCRLPAAGETCDCVVCGTSREASGLRRDCNELEAAAVRERLQSRILKEAFEHQRERVVRANQIVAEAWRQRDAAWRERDFLAETAIGVEIVPTRSDLEGRLRAALEEIEGAREEAFRYDFKVDCDPDDPEAVQAADDLRTLVGWIAEAEYQARRERDEAYARENPYRTADGKAIVLGETEVWTPGPISGRPVRLGICYSVTRGIRLGDTLYVLVGGSMATPIEWCYSSEQAVLNAMEAKNE